MSKLARLLQETGKIDTKFDKENALSKAEDLTPLRTSSITYFVYAGSQRNYPDSYSSGAVYL